MNEKKDEFVEILSKKLEESRLIYFAPFKTDSTKLKIRELIKECIEESGYLIN